MRILMLTQVVVYPANAGPKIKTLQVLKHLAASHEVIYCTFVRSPEEVSGVEKLRGICQRIITVPLKRSRISDLGFLIESLVTGDSFLLHRDDRAAMRAAVRQLLSEEHIDVLHVDQLTMMRFVPSDWSGIVILDEHNAVWQVVERLQKGTLNPISHWLSGREVRLIRKLEGKACQRSHLVLAVSEQDKQALREVAGESTPIEVVPIAVDAESFDDIWSTRSPSLHRLLTVGTMFWPSNSEGVIWWLRTGYEKLRMLYPDLTYDIVGARPPHTLQVLAQQHAGVHLHGFVDDLTPFWKSATALVVPLLSGGGVRVKILEAMAMGVPVISTTIGCEGLEVRHGIHLLIADTPEAFALACVRLFQDKELTGYLAHNARQLILERYDAKVALQALDTAYTLLQVSPFCEAPLQETHPRVSVIVPAARPQQVSQTLVSQTLATLSRQRYAGEIEIIVVGPPAEQLAQRWPIIPINLGPTREPGKVRNLGAAHATGDVLLFLDDDMLVAEDWVEQNVQAMRQPKVGAVGAHLPGKSRAFFARCSDFTNCGYYQHGRILDGPVASGSMGVVRTVFDAVGGFDETLRSSEDMDLCYRIQKHGYRTLYQPGIVVIHDHHQDTLGKLLHYNYARGLAAGLTTKIRYRDVGLKNRLLFSVRFPLIFLLLLPLIALLATLHIVAVNIRENKRALLYAPFILLGKFAYEFGIFRQLTLPRAKQLHHTKRSQKMREELP